MAESDSEDSDSPFEMAEETTAGLESGEESEFWIVCSKTSPSLGGKNRKKFMRCDHAVLT